MQTLRVPDLTRLTSPLGSVFSLAVETQPVSARGSTASSARGLRDAFLRDAVFIGMLLCGVCSMKSMVYCARLC
ncbi:Uncharacterised protein [Mycobacterium tuberculosis]|nr:Uncharacterised protein [Mycobacterium tuberculosis]